MPGIANHVPHLQISWDPQRITIAPTEAGSLLRKSDPSIVMSASEKNLSMNSFMLQPGEERIIADHLVQLLKAHSA